MTTDQHEHTLKTLLDFILGLDDFFLLSGIYSSERINDHFGFPRPLRKWTTSEELLEHVKSMAAHEMALSSEDTAVWKSFTERNREKYDSYHRTCWDLIDLIMLDLRGVDHVNMYSKLKATYGF